MKYRYIFGPVTSRRLGKSLGIDLVPYKTCTLDCIYCECGKTNNLTLKRKEYAETKLVIEEIDNYLNRQSDIDYITFSGSGEPTLHIGIGEIINFLKENYSNNKIALLTNSTLLNDRTVLKEIKEIDLLIPSLDAVSQETFKKINRPIAYMNSEDIINSLINLKNIVNCPIWLEIFIVPGINDNQIEIKKLTEAVEKINPTRVHVNTLDRPGTKKSVKKINKTKLIDITKHFKRKVDII